MESLQAALGSILLQPNAKEEWRIQTWELNNLTNKTQWRTRCLTLHHEPSYKHQLQARTRSPNLAFNSWILIAWKSTNEGFSLTRREPMIDSLGNQRGVGALLGIDSTPSPYLMRGKGLPPLMLLPAVQTWARCQPTLAPHAPGWSNACCSWWRSVNSKMPSKSEWRWRYRLEMESSSRWITATK